MYEPRVMTELRQVRHEAREPTLLDRLVRVVEEQRGHTLAMEVEEAKIALSDARQADIPLEWVAPGLNAAIARPDLVGHTRQLAERIAARVKICLAQARLSASDIDAVFLTGGSVRLAHVRKAITKAVPSAHIVEGDTFVAGLLQPASALAEIVGIGTFSDRLLPPASKAASDCRPAACVAGLAWSRYA